MRASLVLLCLSLISATAAGCRSTAVGETSYYAGAATVHGERAAFNHTKYGDPLPPAPLGPSMAQPVAAIDLLYPGHRIFFIPFPHAEPYAIVPGTMIETPEPGPQLEWQAMPRIP